MAWRLREMALTPLAAFSLETLPVCDLPHSSSAPAPV